MDATKRVWTGLGLLLLPVAVGSGCSGDDDGGGQSRERTARTEAASGVEEGDERDRAAVDVVVEALVEYPRAEYRGDDEPRCIAEEIVDRFGVGRLEELGLDLEAGTGPDLFVPGLTEPERDEMAAAYDACLDMQARDVEAFMADGLTEEQALCVSRAYRSSGIPRSHQTEPPHSTDLSAEPERVRQAHALLDELLTVVKRACQAWIPPGTEPGEYRP